MKTTIVSFFSAVIQAFYSKPFYREVGKKWRGTGLLYLLVLVFISWVPVVMLWMVQVEKINISGYENSELQTQEDPINVALKSIIAQMPVITINKGEASIEEQQPYQIKAPYGDVPLVVIDTTIKGVPSNNDNALIFIGKKDIYWRSNYGEIHYTLAELFPEEKTVVNQQTMVTWIGYTKSLMRWFLPLILFPVIGILSFLYNAVNAVVLAVIGMVMAKILKAELRFADIFRLTVVAATPVIFFERLSLLSPPTVLMPYLGFVFLGLTMWYLYYAISANQPGNE